MDRDRTRTVGELRAAIAAEDLGWEVDARLHDDDPIPEYPTGGMLEARPTTEEVPLVDFPSLTRDRTANPMLAVRSVARGFAAPDLISLLEPPPDLDLTAEAADAAPTMVDWRHRWGWPWITTIRNQDGCSSCWVFAATALVEAMTRIEHAVWTHRSEGDVHKGMGAVCTSTGDARNALNWIESNGLADPECFPWTATNIPYTPSPDRNGRTVKIDKITMVNLEDAKTWLDTVGPLVTSFDVYNDFFGWGPGGGPYVRSATATRVGGHDVLLVGYDDSQSCWIVKNSWDVNWGDNGYCRIRYGECKIDDDAKVGVTGTDPGPLTRRRLHNGCVFESGRGAQHRDFELLAQDGPRLSEWTRDGDPPFPWRTGASFADDVGSDPTYISTTFNRNFEAIYTTDQHRLHHWWFDRRTDTWRDGGVFGPTDAVGTPGFIQGNNGKPGNFEVVVRTTGAELNHWWRDGTSVWRDGGRFGSDISHMGPSLLQGRTGKNGSLELVCVLNDTRMQHWWRHGDEMTWSIRDTFSGDGYRSAPCMIEGQWGADDETQEGNYELCVVRGKKIEHWWRWNQGDQKWRHSATFGDDAAAVVGMVEGSFGFNLEVIVRRTDGRLRHYWRAGPAFWFQGPIIG